MVQRKGMFVFVVILMIFLFSCVPGQKSDLKSISDMTPKERVTWMLSVYNSQTRDYKAMVAKTDLTNEQKEVLRKKKAIMIQVYPMINTYTTYVDSGAVPTKEVEDQIIDLINDLTGLVL